MTEPAIDTGMILEALNDKVDRDCRNVDTTSGADVVVEYQRPTAENNYTWYRLYKSGWIEQGGPNNTMNKTITFPKEMANTNYTIIGPGFVIANYGRSSVITKTTTGFTTDSSANNSGTDYWEVKGFAAQS